MQTSKNSVARLFRALVLGSIALSSGLGFTQQPEAGVPSSASLPQNLPRADVAEIRAEIAALQQRLQQLEARLAQESSAPAAPSPNTEGEQHSFFRSVEVSGTVDGYYEYNFLDAAAKTQLRNFDNRHNQFSLNLLEVSLEKKPSESSRTGFRLGFFAGPAADMIHASEPGGAEVYRYIGQAYASYLAPVGRGVQIDVGKFVTPAGAEVIETRDNWNYSRSLLFALAVPYYHAGIRTTYAFNDAVSFSTFLVNGWNNAEDNNSGKTAGASVTLKPTKKLSWTQSFFAGPEQTADTHDIRYLSDSVLSYQLHPKLALLANYDYGADRVSGSSVRWQGIAAYAHWNAAKSLALTPRYEYYRDAGGFTTGTTQTLQEFTFTAERSLGASLLTRLEFRRDHSDHDYFKNTNGALQKSQSTAAVGLVYSFSSRAE